jgi:cholesterol oxidase
MSRSDYEVIIVGSGFGGAVMAHRLAAASKRVCVLERGKAYPPGSFARRPHELGKNFWDPRKGMHGMFDIWSFTGIEAVVASGLGGGSLIYANVLVRKPEKWFVTQLPDGGYRRWPITRSELEEHYAAVEKAIGVQVYPFEDGKYQTPKTLAFRDAAARLRLPWEPLPLAVTFTAPGETGPIPGQPFDLGGKNLHRSPRQTCRLCGECDVGCNFGAKNTLDYNLLSRAAELGAELRTGHEVRAIRPRRQGGFEVDYVVHEASQEGKPIDTSRLPPHTIAADRLVLCAGTLGSTYLLLKFARAAGGVSERLGHGFSGNGDLLTFAHSARGASGPRLLAPTHGPVITSAIHPPLDAELTEALYYIEDAGLPEFAAWLLEAAHAGGVLRRFARLVVRRVRAQLRRSPVTEIGSQIGQLIGAGERSGSMMPLLGMGMDVPEGTMYLRPVDGRDYLALDWPNRASAGFFDALTARSRDIAEAMGARLMENPLKKLFGRLVTVHPLGGCAMGENPAEGVVDSYCRVHGWPGLYVADGSVMPGPVGPNPSLTIAAIADRAATRMLDDLRTVG